MAFEAGLELGGLFSIVERDSNLNLPWPVLCRMDNLTRIVAAEPVFQIVGQSDVMSCRVGLANEKVDVGEIHCEGFSFSGGEWTFSPASPLATP